MELKTYSRARSAVAAAKKALSHLDVFITDITAADHGDKHIAVVSVKSGGGKEIMDAVKAAGFSATMAEDPVVEELAEAVEAMDAEEQEVEDEAEDEAEDETEALPDVKPAKGKGGYINEVSLTGGACELAREIARSMPDAPRKEVIAACRKAGVAYGTARTQLQRVRGGK